MSIKIPEGWNIKNFGVTLKPGKPEGATSWFDIEGRPVILQGKTWTLDPKLQKTAPQEETAKPTLEELSKRVVDTGKEWARMQGTPKGAAARANFEKAKQDLRDAKDAEEAAKSVKSSSLLEELKQAANPKPTQKTEEKNNGPSEQVQKPKSDSGGGELTPEEQQEYNAFAKITEEGLDFFTRKSYYPNPEQAQRDEENRRRRGEPYLKLSEDQRSAIGAYTGHWDWNMNSMLRTGKVEKSTKQTIEGKDPPSDKQINKAIKDLTSALESLPDAPPGTFHRALSGFVNTGVLKSEASDYMKQLQSLQEGDIIEDPGFSSFTAAGAPVVDRFLKGEPNSDQNLVFEVTSSKMKDISPISKYQREREHMLPPGAKFKVIGRIQSSSRTAGKHTILKLEQI